MANPKSSSKASKSEADSPAKREAEETAQQAKDAGLKPEKKPLTDEQKAQADAYSQNRAAGGQDPNIRVASPEGGESKTITPDELRKSKQPTAPEHPLRSPKEEAQAKNDRSSTLEKEFDETDPAPEKAPLPVEKDEK